MNALHESRGHQFHRKRFTSIISAFYEAQNGSLPKCPVCRGRLTESSTAAARRQQDETDRFEQERERRRDQRLRPWDQSMPATEASANDEAQNRRHVHDFRPPPTALGTQRSSTTSRTSSASMGFQPLPTALNAQRTSTASRTLPQTLLFQASAATDRLMSFRSIRHEEMLSSVDEATAAA